jgi:hypothetical protein
MKKPYSPPKVRSFKRGDPRATATQEKLRMKRSEIEAMEPSGEIQTQRDGKWRVVRRFQDLATGQEFEIDDTDGSWRCSPVPSPSSSRVSLGEWCALDPET